MSTPEPTPDTATWSQEPEPEPAPMGGEDSADDELDPRVRELVTKLKKENRSLRTRLRDAEEIAGAASARENVHTREAVAAAAAQAGLIDGEDLFFAHPDPSEFLDSEFKSVVGDRVTSATQELLRRKPYLGRPVGRPPTDRPVEGLRPGASPEPVKPKTPTWFEALGG